jgi:hypothetical protein
MDAMTHIAVVPACCMRWTVFSGIVAVRQYYKYWRKR